jgi:hypothetical protein
VGSRIEALGHVGQSPCPLRLAHHARLLGPVPVELRGLLSERPLMPLLFDSLEPFVFQAIVAEYIDRAGHAPDFVAARSVRNGDGPIGARKLNHDPGQFDQRCGE